MMWVLESETLKSLMYVLLYNRKQATKVVKCEALKRKMNIPLLLKHSNITIAVRIFDYSFQYYSKLT